MMDPNKSHHKGRIVGRSEAHQNGIPSAFFSDLLKDGRVDLLKGVFQEALDPGMGERGHTGILDEKRFKVS